MASETASSVDEEYTASVQAPFPTDKRGKHRIVAELKRLEQDNKFLEVHLPSIKLAIASPF
ncbi:hypothetical protein SESBI_06342 [Sesbania bispinosa]|nr:hypothetical protein SESBI_06342 [Sesbania bispinosa]